MSLASRPPLRVVMAFALLAAAFIPASWGAPAATWNEIGDAGDLPGNAQTTFGSGTLTSINGNLFGDSDVDMYCISITDEANFSARYVSCTVHADPDLWLFTANGLGVTHADFCQGSFVTLTSAFVNTNGQYYLAISGTDGDALRAGVTIWQSTNAIFAERAPDGPGAPGPISSWGGARTITRNAYTIAITGAEFCDFPVPSLPSTWGKVKGLYFR